jgi:hypothetical protein
LEAWGEPDRAAKPRKAGVAGQRQEVVDAGYVDPLHALLLQRFQDVHALEGLPDAPVAVGGLGEHRRFDQQGAALLVEGRGHRLAEEGRRASGKMRSGPVLEPGLGGLVVLGAGHHPEPGQFAGESLEAQQAADQELEEGPVVRKTQRRGALGALEAQT